MSLLPQTSLDRRLLRSAAKYESPEQMSERVLGQLTPAQCIDRVKTLLASRTILDEVEERRMLLISMAEHLDWLRDQRENPKSWNAIGRAYKLLSDQIERANLNVNDISTKLAEDHARMFVEGISVGFGVLLKALAERDIIDIPAEDQPELLALAAAESSRYLETQTQKVVDA